MGAEQQAAEETPRRLLAQALRRVMRQARSGAGSRQPAETALHPGLPRERKGVREMRELREMKEALEAVRAKGIREMTPADLTALIVRAVRLAGVISGVMALKGIITDLAVIITALREATRDRMVDLSGAKSRVRVSIRRPR